MTSVPNSEYQVDPSNIYRQYSGAQRENYGTSDAKNEFLYGLFFYQQLFISCQDSSPAYIGFTLEMPVGHA